MGGIGGSGHVTACELVPALCPCLDAFQSVGNGKIDSLIIAGLKMQEGAALGAASVFGAATFGASALAGSAFLAAVFVVCAMRRFVSPQHG